MEAGIIAVTMVEAGIIAVTMVEAGIIIAVTIVEENDNSSNKDINDLYDRV